MVGFLVVDKPPADPHKSGTEDYEELNIFIYDPWAIDGTVEVCRGGIRVERWVILLAIWDEMIWLSCGEYIYIYYNIQSLYSIYIDIHLKSDAELWR